MPLFIGAGEQKQSVFLFLLKKSQCQQQHCKQQEEVGCTKLHGGGQTVFQSQFERAILQVREVHRRFENVTVGKGAFFLKNRDGEHLVGFFLHRGNVRGISLYVCKLSIQELQKLGLPSDHFGLCRIAVCSVFLK